MKHIIYCCTYVVTKGRTEYSRSSSSRAQAKKLALSIGSHICSAVSFGHVSFSRSQQFLPGYFPFATATPESQSAGQNPDPYGSSSTVEFRRLGPCSAKGKRRPSMGRKHLAGGSKRCCIFFPSRRCISLLMGCWFKPFELALIGCGTPLVHDAPCFVELNSLLVLLYRTSETTLGVE